MTSPDRMSGNVWKVFVNTGSLVRKNIISPKDGLIYQFVVADKIAPIFGNTTHTVSVLKVSMTA